MHPRTAARRGALRTLVIVESTDQPSGAALTAQRLPAEARAFANEITAGTLRHRARLDYALSPLLKKPLAALDAPVRNGLRLAAYEHYLLGTPLHVVGSEYAGLMRAEKLTSAVGFVNAVVRRLPPHLRPSPAAGQDPVGHLSIEYSHPAWLVERWLARWGFAACEAVCRANNQVAPLSLRANTLRTSRDAVLGALRERGLHAAAGELAPDAILVAHAGDPTGWPEWRDGLILAQDEAAQLVAMLADPQPGQTIVDAAAAPGGKTTHLAQLIGDRGRIIACDAAPGRLKLVRENAQRLGMKSIELQAGDFRELAPALPAADLVLLDAPCLGTGTFRRRPDARWRKTMDRLAELTALQRDLLEAAAQVVRPGGAIVYATCSLEPEENEEQAVRWLAAHPDWALEAATAAAGQVPPVAVTPEGFLRTRPDLHGCDGMFAAKFRRIH